MGSAHRPAEGEGGSEVTGRTPETQAREPPTGGQAMPVTATPPIRSHPCDPA